LDTQGLVREKGRPTTVKTRVIAHSQQIVRYDRETKDLPSEPAALQLFSWIEKRVSDFDVLILSDYAKGVLGGGLPQAAIEAFKSAKKPTLVDPKIKNFENFKGATVITPNYREACEAVAVHAGIHVDTPEDLERGATVLLEQMGCDHLVVTKGEDGMHIYSPREKSIHIPTAAQEVYDVSGAGDTVIATLGLGLGAGSSLTEAVDLANHAAGVAVGKFGTATVEVEELRRSILAE